MDINVVGTFNVNHAFFPLLSRGQNQLSARIVNVASEVSYAAITAAFNAPYSMSKLAVESYSIGLRQELSCLANPVDVIVLNPGAVATDMVGSQLRQESNAFLQHIQRNPNTLFKSKLEIGATISQAYMKSHQVSPSRVAEAVYQVLHCQSPPSRICVNVSTEMILASIIPQFVLDAAFKYIL
jgi:short-subunit dehydrogenase